MFSLWVNSSKNTCAVTIEKFTFMTSMLNVVAQFQ